MKSVYLMNVFFQYACKMIKLYRLVWDNIMMLSFAFVCSGKQNIQVADLINEVTQNNCRINKLSQLAQYFGWLPLNELHVLYT